MRRERERERKRERETERERERWMDGRRDKLPYRHTVRETDKVLNRFGFNSESFPKRWVGDPLS